jgi:hypothetical protein
MLVEAILGTTLQWLDVTPTSRVITRCTQDIRAGTYTAYVLYIIY